MSDKTNQQNLRSASKFLSYVLRHHPEEIGLELDEYGWAEVKELIKKSLNAGKEISRPMIEEVIQSGSKKRFILSEDKQFIRAGYGHSIDIDLNLDPKSPPDILYHGTARENLNSIMEKGIVPQSRNFVHLSTTKVEARNVGGRHGKPIILEIQSGKMNNGEEYPFYQSESEPDIWLVPIVPPRYIETPDL